MPRYNALFLNSKGDAERGERQNLPDSQDDSVRVIVVEPTPMLAPLLDSQLRDDGIVVASASSVELALSEAGVLALILSMAEAQASDGVPEGAPPIVALIPAGGTPILGVVATMERPARLDALVAVIRGLPRAVPVLEIGSLILDAKTRRLSDRSGIERARLTEKEAEILSALLRAPAGRIDRDALLRDVWRYHNAVQSHTMETHIYRLRRKLIEAEPSLAGAIETVAGGYRLRLAKQA